MIRVVRCFAEGDPSVEDEIPLFGAVVPGTSGYLVKATPRFVVQSLQSQIDDKVFTEDVDVDFTYRLYPKRAKVSIKLGELLTHMRVLANELMYARRDKIFEA